MGGKPQTATISPEDLRAALKAKGYMRQVDMAAGLKVSQASMSEYLSGNQDIPGIIEVALAGLPRFRATNGAVAPPQPVPPKRKRTR